MKRANWLILAAVAVAALQIGFLAWAITGRAAVLRDGQEVLLKVLPVDPRDLLRGDYVRLGYDVSRLPRAIFQPPITSDVEEGTPVFVLLRRGTDGVFAAAAAAFDHAALATPADGEAIVRGAAQRFYSDSGVDLFVDYGIERFYLPEGEGLQIEKDMRERPFFVVVAVAEDGTAQIKRFLDDKTVLYEEPLY